MNREAIRLNNVSIIKGGVSYLKDISFSVRKGEIYGLLGFNGLGINVLVEMLTKNIPLEYGSFYIENKLVNNHLYSDGASTQVEVIALSNNLVENMSVLDNIFVLRPEFKGRTILSSHRKKLENELADLTAEIDVKLDGDSYVDDLNRLEKCVVSLLRARVSRAPLVVCYHLGNYLSPSNLLHFHQIMNSYKEKGMSFLYLCDHHEEAFQICDRSGLMYGGRLIKKLEKQDMDGEIIWGFVNNIVASHNSGDNMFFERNSFQIKQRYEGAEGDGKKHDYTIENIKFQVREGECLILLDNDNGIFENIPRFISLAQRLKSKATSKVSFIEEDPTKRMVFSNMSYMDNLCFTRGNVQPKIWASGRFKKSIAQEYYHVLGDDLFVRDIENLPPASIYTLVYYRCIVEKADVVFIKQPFAWADMLLRNHILSLIDDLKNHGIAVVIFAINLADCLAVGDRLLLIEGGKLQHIYERKDFPEISNRRLEL